MSYVCSTFIGLVQLMVVVWVTLRSVIFVVKIGMVLVGSYLGESND
jgi:hypothetical protein